MTPDVHIRLTSVLHGLRDVIVPAVDPGASLAQEQCGLVLAQLDMLLRQLPWIERYPALCRDDLRATALSIVDAPDGGVDTRDAAARLAALLAAPSLGDAQADYDRIGFGVEALVFAVSRDGAPAYRARVDAEILRFGRRQNTRERTWFAGTGFDPRPEEIGSIAEMFVK
mgnify:FL=1